MDWLLIMELSQGEDLDYLTSYPLTRGEERQATKCTKNSGN